MLVFSIERLSFSDVSHIILDEADSLFDQSFEESLFKILKMMKVYLQMLTLILQCYNF